MPSQQRYVSRELTHFVGRSLPDDDARYDLLVKILRSGWLKCQEPETLLRGKVEIKPHALLSSNELFIPYCVCFCDIPVGDLAVHMTKYSRFGLAFTKEFLVEKGAGPVLYIAKRTVIQDSDIIIEQARQVLPPEDVKKLAATIDPEKAKLRAGDVFDRMFPRGFLGLFPELFGAQSPLTHQQRIHLKEFYDIVRFHVFGFLKFFDHCLPDDHPENFYMEREWRILGNLDFDLADAHRVILPKRYAKRLREDVPDYCGQITFAE